MGQKRSVSVSASAPPTGATLLAGAIFCIMATHGAAAQSVTEKAIDEAKHVNEYLDLLHSKDEGVRQSAMRMALTDQSPVVRGMAVSAYLNRFNALTPEVVLDPGSQIGREDAPLLAMTNVKWSQDGKSFTASMTVFCGGSRAIDGQVVGERLSLSFGGLCLSSNLVPSSPNRGQNAPRLTAHQCVITLILNEKQDALEGPLHCLSLPLTMKIRLPLG